jgi:uncharacterized protein DUF1707/cell wall-active antibiotic response 4TMS protein YvqF
MPKPPLPESLLPVARERAIAALTHHFANDELTETEFEARLQSVYAATTTQEIEAITADLSMQREGADIAAFLSGQERKLTGVMPRELKVRARLGYVELDLTKATFKPGVTTIDVGAFMGYVHIRVPAGVRVDSAGRALFGFFSVKGKTADSACVVRIVGRATFGFAEVRTASLRPLS